MGLKTAWICDRNTKQKIIAIGTIQSITDNVSSSNLTKPIITYTAENTFTMDMNTTQQFTIKFERNNDSNDGNNMTNEQWITEMRKLINQWQAEHDGYILMYNKDETSENPKYMNHSPIFQPGYIKSFSTTFKCGVPEHISGSLVFQSGTMKPQKSMVTYDTSLNEIESNDIVTDADDVEFHSDLFVDLKSTIITMTGSNQQDMFTLYSYSDGGSDESCITSYSLTYGPTEPFPLLSMSINKKRLAAKYTSLVDDIVAGKNRIEVKACGTGKFVVTKCRSNDQTYTITAYALEEVYKGIQTGEVYSAASSPLDIIKRILSKKMIVGGTPLTFTPNKIICPHTADEINSWDTWNTGGAVTQNAEVMFSPTDTCWRVMSICAQYMGMTIWFAEEYVFLARQNWYMSKTIASEHLHRIFYLNNVDDSDRIIQSEDDRKFSSRVIDSPKIGDEGIDTLYNRVGIRYTLGLGQTSTGVVYSADYSNPNIFASQEAYGTRPAGEISVPEFSRLDVARQMANNLATLTTDTQLSITFTVSETRIEVEGGVEHNRWRSFFPLACAVNGIVDYNTDTRLSIDSSYAIDSKGRKSKLPQKTYLSSITRNFPEFTSTYTFGRIANADLSQTTSNILQAIGNK